MIRAKVGIISTTPGDKPFYTISDNPQTCYNMQDGASCNQTWTVNATGGINTSYDFFTIYSPIIPGIEAQTTPHVNITITDTSSFDINLFEGWNLISSPLNFTDLSEILQPILPQIEEMFMYDAINQEFVEVNPATTTEINLLHGFWIKVSGSTTLTISGEPFDAATMPLETGLNLVGHPSTQNQNVADTYSTYDVYSYNTSWSSYIPERSFNSLQTLKPGYGYWVKSE